ncbi:MAG: M48 family metallopeptidase [Parvularculaceae bacterium]
MAIIMTEHKVTMSRREIIRGLAAGSVFAYVGGCTYNEELGRSQLLLVSSGQMAQLAASAWTDLKRQEKLSTDRRYRDRVNRVMPRIIAAGGDNPANWEYEVFESDQLNAFALPGGRVGFYTGILDIMENDSQIATVGGHEYVHVRANHSGERYSQALTSQAGLAAAQVAVASSDSSYGPQLLAALGLGVQLGVLLPFSRRHELEADRLGLRYMYRAGYDPNEAVRFWQNMEARSQGGRPPEFLSTHPGPERRIAQLQREIALLPPRPRS